MDLSILQPCADPHAYGASQGRGRGGAHPQQPATTGRSQVVFQAANAGALPHFRLTHDLDRAMSIPDNQAVLSMEGAAWPQVGGAPLRMQLQTWMDVCRYVCVYRS